MDENKENAPLSEPIQTQTVSSDVNQKIDSINNNAKPDPKKKISIITIIVIVIVLVGLGVGTFFLLDNINKSEQKNAVEDKAVIEPKPQPEPSLKPTETIISMQDFIKTKYPDVMPQDSELSGEQIYFKDSDKAPAWKISGEKIYVGYLGDGAYSTDVYFDYSGPSDFKSASNRFMAISEAMIQSLINQGFSKDINNAYNSESSDRVVFIKDEDDVVCIVSSPESVSPPVSAACGQVSRYTKDLADYKDVEPYIAAYEKASKMSEGSIIRFTSLNNGMSGYKNVKVSLGNVGSMVGGAMGLFYKAPTSDWAFFTGTQSVIPCTDFNTKDLQYSFAYEPCFDTTKRINDATIIVQSYYDLQ